MPEIIGREHLNVKMYQYESIQPGSIKFIYVVDVKAFLFLGEPTRMHLQWNHQKMKTTQKITKSISERMPHDVDRKRQAATATIEISTVLVTLTRQSIFCEKKLSKSPKSAEVRGNRTCV